MLAYESKYKICLGISAFLFSIMVFLLFMVVLKGILNIKKLKENPSANLVVTQGLNKMRKIYPMFYFFHFFFI